MFENTHIFSTQRKLIKNCCGAYKKIATEIKISSLITLILILLGCRNAEQKQVNIIEKEYGIFENEKDSIGVELNLTEFKNWKDILERTEQIACNDSIPRITIKNNSIVKKIYLRNPCWKNFDCILIKERNTIQFHNDTISKSDGFFYPLDSLRSVLRKDFYNNGKIPSWSQNPQKLLIFISYDDYRIENFTKTLDKIVSEYEEISDSIVLKIWLNEKINIPPPPPPPPKELTEIELIGDEKY